MKKITFIICLLLLAAKSFAQPQLTEHAKLASLCKVWGFLKYYHPEVGKGKRDWDQELMKRIDPVASAKDKQALNRIYIDWIHSLGYVNPLKSTRKPIPDSLKKNVDFRWMDDGNTMSDSLSAMLHYIEQNKRGHRNYYVKINAFTIGIPKFIHEDAYADSVFPGYELRLLCLFRYWNMANYYFGCKYANEKNWGETLGEMIPLFTQAKNKLSYGLAILCMTHNINDSHAYVWRPEQHGTYKFPAFVSKIVNNKCVVTKLADDSLAKIDDIRVGDLILAIDGKSIADLIAFWSQYLSASNEATRLSRLYYLGADTVDNATMTFDRSGIVTSKTIHRYSHQFTARPKSTTMPFKQLDAGTGYIKMDIMKRRDVRPAMKQLKHTTALIVDVRNYPKKGIADKLAHYLNRERKPFVTFTWPRRNYPGVVKMDLMEKCGRKNRHYYRGKVIVLFDESTQSEAEYSCMMLKTAPDAVCIGSQTAAADGGVVSVALPGGYRTRFSAQCPHYPNGQSLARIGLLPDIEVKPTIEGIRQHRDEVMERAIEYARTGK